MMPNPKYSETILKDYVPRTFNVDPYILSHNHTTLTFDSTLLSEETNDNFFVLFKGRSQ
jgi:hypothetical protein